MKLIIILPLLLCIASLLYVTIGIPKQFSTKSLTHLDHPGLLKVNKSEEGYYIQYGDQFMAYYEALGSYNMLHESIRARTYFKDSARALGAIKSYYDEYPDRLAKDVAEQKQINQVYHIAECIKSGILKLEDKSGCCGFRDYFINYKDSLGIEFTHYIKIPLKQPEKIGLLYLRAMDGNEIQIDAWMEGVIGNAILAKYFN